MRAESTGLPRTSIDAHGALQFRFERARHGIRYVVRPPPTIGDWSDPESLLGFARSAGDPAAGSGRNGAADSDRHQFRADRVFPTRKSERRPEPVAKRRFRRAGAPGAAAENPRSPQLSRSGHASMNRSAGDFGRRPLPARRTGLNRPVAGFGPGAFEAVERDVGALFRVGVVAHRLIPWPRRSRWRPGCRPTIWKQRPRWCPTSSIRRRGSACRAAETHSPMVSEAEISAAVLCARGCNGAFPGRPGGPRSPRPPAGRRSVDGFRPPPRRSPIRARASSGAFAVPRAPAAREAEGEQRVARQYGGGFVEHFMAGRAAAPEVAVVDRGQVVVNQGIGVEALHGDGGRQRVGAGIEEFRPEKEKGGTDRCLRPRSE